MQSCKKTFAVAYTNLAVASDFKLSTVPRFSRIEHRAAKIVSFTLNRFVGKETCATTGLDFTKNWWKYRINCETRVVDSKLSKKWLGRDRERKLEERLRFAIGRRRNHVPGVVDVIDSK